MFISHLPHANWADTEYGSALCISEESPIIAKKICYVIVGVDANAIVGEQSLNDSHRTVATVGMHTRNERGVVFVAWLHINRL